MKLREFIDAVEAGGGYLSVSNGSIRVSLRKGTVLSDEQRKFIKQHKEQLISHIEANVYRTVNRHELQPLSHYQQSLWTAAQYDNDSQEKYNVPCFFDIRGELSLTALEKSFNLLIGRHETLRTKVILHDGVPCQKVFPPYQVNIQVIKINPENLDDYLRGITLHKFALEHDFPLKIDLFRLEENRHILAVNQHHIITDGVSIKILLQEIEICYAAYCRSEIPHLAEQPFQYVDFCERNTRTAAKIDSTKDEEYWRQQLGQLRNLNMLAKFNHPANGKDAVLERFSFSPQETAKIKDWTNRQESSLFAFLNTLVSILFYKYTNHSEVLLGVPASVRNNAVLEDMQGYFVNPLLLKTPVQDELLFTELLANVEDTVVSALEHRCYPFSRVVNEILAKGADLNGGPLQIVLSLQESISEAKLELAGLDVETIDAYRVAKYPILFVFTDADDYLACRLSAQPAYFSADELRRLAGHLKTICHQVLNNDELKIKDISLLTPDEITRLKNYSGINECIPITTDIRRHFNEALQLNPKKTALRYHDKNVSYEELERITSVLAAAISECLPDTGNRGVCFYLPEKYHTVFAIVGIIKAGAHYIPLDTSAPAERNNYVIEHSDASLLIIGDDSAGKSLAEKSHKKYLVFNPEHYSANKPAAFLPKNATASIEEPAYTIYTSGSTGTPKGVTISHAGVVSLVKNSNYLSLKQSDVILHLSSIAFDAATFEIWGALLNGATLAILDKEEALSPELLQSCIARYKASIAFMTTALFNNYVDHNPACLMGLNQLLFGGEAVNTQKVMRFLAHAEKTVLLHVYGPTETTTFATYSRLDASKIATTAPIGKPLTRQSCYVLDKNRQLVPEGIAGELYIGGEGLALEYCNDPQLTQARFIRHVWPDGREERLYKTGDIVQWSRFTAGELEFIGRNDSQVKIRGFRIELDEISHVLNQQSLVAQSYVRMQQSNDDKQLVAYIVPSVKVDDEAAQAEALRQKLAQCLPYYMVPAGIVFIDILPLNVNGKVDADKLPSPNYSADTKNFTAPQTAREKQVAAIWSKILKRDRVGLHDNFFYLGGNSLLAFKLCSELQKSLKIVLNIRAVFDKPTLLELSSFIDSIQADRATVHEFITTVERGAEHYPVSSAQEKMWFINRFKEAKSAYNVPALFRLSGELNFPRLKECLYILTQRHEVLRSTFCLNHNSELSQQLKVSPDVCIKHIEAKGSSKSQIEAEIQADMTQAFDLEKGPLLRVTVYCLGDGENILLLNQHHIICDGWSVGILCRELSALYNQPAKPDASLLDSLAAQYIDYASWQKQGQDHSGIDFWADYLKDYSEVSLPSLKPRPQVFSYRGKSIRVTLDRELSQQVKRHSNSLGTSAFNYLLSAYYILLARYCSAADIVVGTPVANRTRPEFEPLLGFFANMICLRNTVNAEHSFRQLLNNVTENSLRCFQHQSTSLESIVNRLSIERDVGKNPIFQIVFSVQHGHKETALELHGLRSAPYREVPYPVAKFDLSVNAVIDDEAIEFNFNYYADLYPARLISGLAQCFITILRQAAADETIAVGDIASLEPSAIEMVRQQKTPLFIPSTPLAIGELFEQIAQAAPDKVAAWHGNRQLSYADLSLKSGCLAEIIRAKYRALRNKEMPPSTFIGLLAERNLDMLVACLAILKAGGAYVPLDPDYPDERLAYMIGDSRSDIIVTQSSLLPRLQTLTAFNIDNALVSDRLDLSTPVNLFRQGMPHHLAYMMYTSGSTGKPKGVRIRQESIVNLAHNTDVPLTADDVILQASNISFDAATFEIWGALLNGASLVIVDKHIVLSPPELGREAARRGITTAFFTTALFNSYCANGITHLSAFKRILIGGEKANLASVRNFLASCPETELINGYGPTEATTFATFCRLTKKNTRRCVPIGKALTNTQCYVFDSHMNLSPDYVPGQLYIGGKGLAEGYHRLPEETGKAFIRHTWPDSDTEALYKTGDIVRRLANGDLEYLHRQDSQVKINGFRIELSEIEICLQAYPGIEQAVLQVKEIQQQKQLLAFYVLKDPGEKDETFYQAEEHAIWRHLNERLPNYLLPKAITRIKAIPLTKNGKVDYSALPTVEIMTEKDSGAPASANAASPTSTPADAREKALADLWQSILGLTRVRVNDRFFDIGGSSILLLTLQARMAAELGIIVSITDLFEYPSIQDLAAYLRNRGGDSPLQEQSPETDSTAAATKDSAEGGSHSKDAGKTQQYAVIGMACRCPGADDKDGYWHNLINGVESISDYTDEQLISAGVEPALLSDPRYIKRGATIRNLDKFDAPFFGYSAREAESMDPQQRHFLECAWEALEDAGAAQDTGRYRIGVFAGQGANQYYLKHIHDNEDAINKLGRYQVRINNQSLATKVSYHLNLKGPSLDINTACSTSLVAINEAIEKLALNKCDLAIAGGVRLHTAAGYLFKEGMIYSKDGRTRPFDRQAQGTLGTSAVGAVVLKTLDKALKDGDHIYCHVIGSAVNNDGCDKVSYTAPSVNGQAAVIESALADAGISPETINYVETHGTGTPLGDPIEIAALTKAYRKFTDKKRFCRIGSVKSNIGHTDTAAGVMGFIKAVLCLKYGKIPATLFFKQANPEIDFANSPFNVNDSLHCWETTGNTAPRRAAVSSFGIGGTNAHVILEEARPPIRPSPEASGLGKYLLTISAKTETSLKGFSAKLGHFLKAHKTIDLADVCYSLQLGRQTFEYRRFYLVDSLTQASSLLLDETASSPAPTPKTGKVAFVFSGQDSQYAGMARNLYEKQQSFRTTFDYCRQHLLEVYRIDILAQLYPAENSAADNTSISPAASFTIGHALAELLKAWGIKPDLIIGHGCGELIAAVHTRALDLEDALFLASRPTIGTFSKALQEVDFKALKLPYISTMNGKRLAEGEMLTPPFRVDRLLCSGEFETAIADMLENEYPCALIELGPESAFAKFIKTHSQAQHHRIYACLPENKDNEKDIDFLLTLIGELWQNGYDIDWKNFYRYEKRLKIPLPTYAFDHRTYWINPSPKKTPLPDGYPNGTQDSIASEAEIIPQLKQIWKALLGVEDVGLNDDFYDLGGHSLLLSTLLEHINKTFKVQLSVIRLEAASTIQEQYELLCGPENNPAEWQAVFTFNAKGHRPPLFLVHPSNAGAEAYTELADLLPDDQPLYGLESYNAAHEDKITDLKELAALYVSRLKQIIPQGPCFLAGWSLGGAIAYEMAKQLLDENRRVLTLYMIDSYGFKDDTQSEWALTSLLKSPAAPSRVPGIDYQLLATYKIPDNKGVTLVFFEATESASKTSPARLWADHAGAMNVHRFETDHYAVMKMPHLQKIAGIMNQDMMCRAMPLNTMQQWFFEEHFEQPNHLNQSVLIKPQQTINAAAMKIAVAQLAAKHAALRSRFCRTDRHWHQYVEDRAIAQHNIFDIADIGDGEERSISHLCAGAHQAIDIVNGPIAKFVLMQSRQPDNDRVLIVIHHLVVNSRCWKLLLGDLLNSYHAALNETYIPPTSDDQALAQWQWAINEQAGTLFKEDTAYWLRCTEHLAPLPADFNCYRSRCSNNGKISKFLSPEQTAALISNRLGACEQTARLLLIAAYALTIYDWQNDACICFNYEQDGREGIATAAGQQDSVAWFTSRHPVRIDMKDGSFSMEDIVEGVRDAINKIPRQGLSYSALRYLNRDPQLTHKLASKGEPRLGFSYFGNFYQTLFASPEWQLAEEKSGPNWSEANHHPNLLDINCLIVNACLKITLTYSKDHFTDATADKLMGRFIDNVLKLAEYFK